MNIWHVVDEAGRVVQRLMAETAAEAALQLTSILNFASFSKLPGGVYTVQDASRRGIDPDGLRVTVDNSWSQ